MGRNHFSMIIFLIGFMGSGKSYYAERIASAMSIPFVDLDAAIEQDQGMSITAIFAQQGEAEFRLLEANKLRSEAALLSADKTHEDLLNRSGNFIGLIACGGGTPCYHDNMEWMNKYGMTVWINPPIEVLKSRLRTEKSGRPLIAGLNEEEFNVFIEIRLQSRERYYSQATIQITDPVMSIDQIIKKIHHAQGIV